MLRALLTRLRWPLLGGAAAALALVTTTAHAGSGVGDVFNLGQTNSVDAQSTLTGNAGTAAQLRVENTGGGAALSLVVNAGVAPLKVNSASKVGSLNADLLDGLDSAAFWKLGGNGGTNPGANFLGTTDNKALELKTNGQRALRLEPTTGTPNVIGGSSANLASPGTVGVTISGGGASGQENRAGDFATIGGGADNVAGTSSTVGGGLSNLALGLLSTVGGGDANEATGQNSVVAGGETNVASSEDNAVGGGASNQATGASGATIAGGDSNVADGQFAAVGGGHANQAVGNSSAVAGGESNVALGTFSFAAGRRAKANHPGAFVWADSTDADFASTGNDQFDVRASGGARFEANVHVTGKLTRAYTAGTSNQATPVAYGAVTNGGSTVTTASTPNVSSNFDSVNKRYVITIAGESYDINHFSTQVTPINTLPRMVVTQSGGGKLLVRIFDLTGTAVQSPFTLVVYKP